MGSCKAGSLVSFVCKTEPIVPKMTGFRNAECPYSPVLHRAGCAMCRKHLWRRNMETIGTWWMWAGFAVFVVVAIAIDLLVMERQGAQGDHGRCALEHSVVLARVCLCCHPSGGISMAPGRTVANTVSMQFITGYLVEKSLGGQHLRLPDAVQLLCRAAPVPEARPHHRHHRCHRAARCSSWWVHGCWPRSTGCCMCSVPSWSSRA